MKIFIILLYSLLLQENYGKAANLIKPAVLTFDISSYKCFPFASSEFSKAPFNLKEYAPPSHWNEPDHTTGLHIGGLLLGLFLPVIGIYIANKIGGKARQNRKKWAVIGTAVTLGIILISLLSKSTKY